MNKLLVSGLSITLLGLWFFSGTMPDSTYKILPGYFSDPNLYWQETPFSKAQVTQLATPKDVMQSRINRQKNTIDEFMVDSDTHVLFGDTHVHTTNSSDAFMFSLPLMFGAQGAFPPGYACDYARFVSQLDFYFLTDHAEAYTAERWSDAIESIRQCNEMAQVSGLQDTFAFMGFEWTQSGITAKTHFGHHNVLFKEYGENDLPARPIGAPAEVATVPKRDYDSKFPKILEFLDPRHKDYYASYNSLVEQMADTPNCEEGIPSPQLPKNCYEEAKTTGALFKKLREWDIDTMVIPHGMAWGFYTPPDSSWKTHLNNMDVDPSMTPLIEIYSGHGNAEQFSNFTTRIKNTDGSFSCPAPTANYLATCWQSGQIIKKRCLAKGMLTTECEARAQVARQLAVNTDTNYAFLTAPGSKAEELLDAGQARNMFNPAFNYRPKKSMQYGLAVRNFDGDKPLGFEWGVIASTDTHTSRAGHGFKQVGRLNASEANGAKNHFFENMLIPSSGEPIPRAQDVETLDAKKLKLRMSEAERVGSYLYLGGLAAVHAKERSRDGIWQAMKDKQVYGTSGHRILMWFNMVDGDKKVAAMGQKVLMNSTPKFKVTVIGSPKQNSGCPDFINAGMDADKLEKMSFGECFNPTQQRHHMDKIEIIRIRPQSFAGEDVADLIEDPWKTFDCPKDSAKCEVNFSDDEFPGKQRDTVYYARAIEEAIPMINANNLNTQFDNRGNAISTDICFGSYETPASDECLALKGHQAWSSPIFTYYK